MKLKDEVNTPGGKGTIIAFYGHVTKRKGESYAIFKVRFCNEEGIKHEMFTEDELEVVK